MKIIRENKKFTTSVCLKPTFRGVFTDFVRVFIPNSNKNVLTFTLLNKALKLGSNFEIKKLKNIFRTNG